MKAKFIFYCCLLLSLSLSTHVNAVDTVWQETFDNLSEWSGGNHNVVDGVLTLDSAKEVVTSRTAILDRHQGKVSFKIKPAEGTPGYANINIHLFTNEQGQINGDTYTLMLYGSESKYFKIIKAGYNTVYFSGSNGGLLTGSDNWHEIEVNITESGLQVTRDGVEVALLEITETNNDPAKNYMTLDANSGRWNFDWLRVNSSVVSVDEPGIDEPEIALWRDNFDDLSHWSGENQLVDAGIMTLDSAKNGITTHTALLDNHESTVNFRVKPAVGTPGYANMQFNLFTNAQGQVNADTYSLMLYGSESKYFKIIKSGYNTVYFSGSNGGLLSGSDNWHQIGVSLTGSTLKVMRDGLEVISIEIPEINENSENRHIAIAANSGRWDFDWMTVDSVGIDGTGGDGSSGGGSGVVDSDNDGLPDSYEIANGLNPNDGTDAANDNDADGLTNLEEFTNGTDLNSPNIILPQAPSNFVVNVVDANRVQLHWDASTNVNTAGYHIYRNGLKISSTDQAGFLDTQLLAATAYQYQLASYDQFGNVSDKSASISATTQSEIIVEGAPVIQPANDQYTTAGELYKYSPTLVAGEDVIWRKIYGHDGVKVNPDTGNVSWSIESTLPSESFYIGVEAKNDLGSTQDTWIVTVGDGQVHYVGSDDGMLTIKDAFGIAVGGDTVVITDGVYGGYPYTLDSNGGAGGFALPPSGTAEKYTTVMAQTPGGVVFNDRIYLAGKRGDIHHLAYKGMLGSQGIKMASGPYDTHRPHHIKFILMGATDSGFSLMNSDYILIESSFSFGSSRYKFISYKSNNVILRRTVSRYDLPPLSGQNSPIASYSIYSSNNVAVQNAIDIDSDALDFYPHGSDIEYGGAFYVPTTAGASVNVAFMRSIALNGRMNFAGYDNTNGTAEVLFEDVIGWDIEIPADEMVHDLTHGHGQADFNHVTIGDVSYQQRPSYLFNGYNYHVDNFTNTLFYNLIPEEDASSVYLFRDVEKLSYNNYFNAGEQHTGEMRAQYLYGKPELPDNYEYDYGSFTYLDPMVNSLRYITRIEANSDLSGIASDDGDIGARVENMVGKSGTLYGEDGWNRDDGVSMWPFPAEGLIKRQMASFSYTGPDYLGNQGTLSGARGFAAEGEGLYGGPITLTSYIWEYLGHACPQNVCQ